MKLQERINLVKEFMSHSAGHFDAWEESDNHLTNILTALDAAETDAEKIAMTWRREWIGKDACPSWDDYVRLINNITTAMLAERDKARREALEMQTDNFHNEASKTFMGVHVEDIFNKAMNMYGSIDTEHAMRALKAFRAISVERRALAEVKS